AVCPSATTPESWVTKVTLVSPAGLTVIGSPWPCLSGPSSLALPSLTTSFSDLSVSTLASLSSDLSSSVHYSPQAHHEQTPCEWH
ncbi:hypothetical protein A2U01_0072872, partial [Trifolium medium]|nr:hypothetical protein [Trifolium medium]